MGQTRSTFGKDLSIFYRNFQMYINRELAQHNVTFSEYAHLLNLNANQKVNQSYFSNALSIDHALTTRVLKSLEQKGLIMRTQDKNDRRNTLIELTKKGEITKPILVAVIEKWEKEIFKTLNDEQFQILENGMSEVARLALLINEVEKEK